MTVATVIVVIFVTVVIVTVATIAVGTVVIVTYLKLDISTTDDIFSGQLFAILAFCNSRNVFLKGETFAHFFCPNF